MDTPLVGLFLSSFIASTLFPGGSEALLVWQVKEGVYELWLLTCVATLGNALGGIVTYYVGRWIAYRFPERTLGAKHPKAQAWLSRYGAFSLLLSWLPVVGDPLCLLAGWLRINSAAACLLITVGKALRYIVVAGVAAQIW